MFPRPHILAVDDEPRGVELVQRILRRRADVDACATGEEAWERFQRDDYDLVISDQRMPGMSGVELLAQIADLSAHTGRILLTGYTDPADAIGAINEGRVHAYLTKPCPPDQLLVTVDSVLKNVSVERENHQLVAELRARQHALGRERLRGLAALLKRICGEFGPGLGRLRDRDPAGEAGRLAARCAELGELSRLLLAPARPEPRDLDGVLEAAVAPLLGEAGVELSLAFGSGARLPVDGLQLGHALRELLLEARPLGAGPLRVASERRGGEAVVAIRLGDPAGAALRESDGSGGWPCVSGLGLSLARKLAADHGGRVEVGEAPGAGRLELILPAGDGAATSTPRAEAGG